MEAALIILIPRRVLQVAAVEVARARVNARWCLHFVRIGVGVILDIPGQVQLTVAHIDQCEQTVHLRSTAQSTHGRDLHEVELRQLDK